MLIRPLSVNTDPTNSCELESELLIFSQHRNALFSLNPSARAVWELCDGQRTAAEIGRIISREVGITEEVLAPDIQQALIQLAEANLVREAEEPAPAEPQTPPLAG